MTKTIDVANALVRAANKMDTVRLSLRLVMDPLEPGHTRDVVEHTVRNLGQLADRLVEEGNTLRWYAAAEEDA